MKSLHRFYSATLAVITVVLVAVLAFAAFQVMSGRYVIEPVLSGSMRPGLPVGGVVIAQQVPSSSLAVGDVAVLSEPTNPANKYVHRITKIAHNPKGLRYSTKGDANPVADPWGPVGLKSATAYRVTAAIPWIGYVAIWLHQPFWRLIAIIAGTLLLLSILIPKTALARLRKTLHLPASKDIQPQN